MRLIRRRRPRRTLDARTAAELRVIVDRRASVAELAGSGQKA